MSNQNHAHAPHKLLEYALTRAAVSGKENKVQTVVPYETLMAGVGKTLNNSDYDLQVTIELKWVPKHHLLSDDDDYLDELTEDEGDEYE